jgi:hypothetical protein
MTQGKGKVREKTNVHAAMRAASRYNLNLSESDRQKMVRDILEDRLKARRKLTCSRSLCLLNWQGQDILLIYSSTRKTIITFLPPDDPKRAWLEEVVK